MFTHHREQFRTVPSSRLRFTGETAVLDVYYTKLDSVGDRFDMASNFAATSLFGLCQNYRPHFGSLTARLKCVGDKALATR